MNEPIGLIAGMGRLTVLTAQGMRASGRQVVCVGLHGQYEPDLPEACDRFKEVGLIRLGQWVRTLRRWGAGEAVMIGAVRKAEVAYDPLLWLRRLPDLKAAKLWYRELRHDRRSQTLLRALADELERCGVSLIDSTRYLPQHLATPGVMTRRAPSDEQQRDIDFGLPILNHLNEMEIGQALAVKGRDVVAVEAIEGTDAMIDRAGMLCRRGGWVLLKGAPPTKDMRYDVPTVGVPTIQRLKDAGCAAIALTAGRVILAEKEQVLAAADEAGIAILGV